MTISTLILFFIFSLIILFSTIGYGLLTVKLLRSEKLNFNYGLIGILGLFSLSIISSYTHLLFSHNYIHNLTIILLGLLCLAILNKNFFKETKYTFIIFIFLFISILMAKTNEDFGYYHLPNSLQFAEQKLQFGLGNLNHGFKHISSLFMIMSLNYLPLFNFYLFNLTNLLFLTFFITFLLFEIYFKNKKNLNLSNILLSFLLILFLTKFARLAEFGSDLSGQIIISMFIFYLLEFFYNEKISQVEKIYYLKISLILITFAVTLKFISVIYSSFYLMFFLVVKNKNFFFLNLIKSNFLIFIFAPLAIFIFLNFSATGCLIYPVKTLCFSEKFDWAVSSDVISYLNFYYELWAKGGAGPNISVENSEDYIKNINWLPHWFSVYFIGKFSDFLLVAIFLILVFSSFYIKNIFSKKKIFKDVPRIKIFYLHLLLIFFLWFFNFPTLRYAGYIVVFLIIIYPFSVFAAKKIDFSVKENVKKLTIIFIISYSVFLIKNVTRINNELSISKNHHNNFANFPLFWIKDQKYEPIMIDGHKVNLTKGACWGIPSTCVKGSSYLKIKKKNNYIFYIKK
tara:strand:+ start:543 stop:2249 length:1707 start_codon:yes stop_codon:yes gene_type:complete